MKQFLFILIDQSYLQLDYFYFFTTKQFHKIYAWFINLPTSDVLKYFIHSKVCIFPT